MTGFAETQQIKNLKGKIAQLQTEVDRWKLDFEIEVKVKKLEDGQREFSLVTAFRHPHGKIFRSEYPAEMMQQYIDDPATLVNTISQEIYNELYKENIRSVVRVPLGSALTNALASMKVVS